MKPIFAICLFALSFSLYSNEHPSTAPTINQSSNSVANLESLQRLLGEQWKLVDFRETTRADGEPRVMFQFKPKNVGSEEKFCVLFDYLSDYKFIKSFQWNMSDVLNSVLDERKRSGLEIIEYNVIETKENSLFFEFTQSLNGTLKHVWVKVLGSNQGLKWHYLYVTDLNEVPNLRPYWEAKFSELS